MSEFEFLGFVDEGARGAFPVYVIRFEDLEEEPYDIT